MAPDAKLRYAGDSDPGRVRSNNEDRVWWDAERGIFLVVDGIGGQAAGEKAADIAVSMIRGRLERQTGTPAERIREAIAVANNEILRAARANSEWEGMACVLTVALLDGDAAYVGHVGDSRLYKIRGGRIEKITHDHSPVGEREDNRELAEAEAMRHPRRNEVYRDVGSEEHTPDDNGFIESIRIPFEPDAALLLCSDGLSDQVTSGEILRAVRENAGNPPAAVRELIAAANQAGGKDNVSVVLVEGPSFAARTASSGGALTSRPAVALYAFLAGLLVLAALQLHFGWLDAHLGPPPKPEPRVLTVASSIADTLAKANPGDTVEVPAGEYREQITLREGVNIVSRVPLEAIVRAARVGISADHIHAARVSGLRILSDEDKLQTGISLRDSDAEIVDCQISGAVVGVAITAGHPVVRASSIQDSARSGLVIGGAAEPWISHNDFARNGRKQKVPTVWIEEPARPVLVGNTFADNGAEAVSIPKSIDAAPIKKFNFFVNGKTVVAR